MSFLRNNNQAHPFLRPELSLRNMDRFAIRSSVLQALTGQRHRLIGTLLDVGCGQMPYKPVLIRPAGNATQYIRLDLADNEVHCNEPDIVWNNGVIPLDDSSVDSAILTEVLEHCPDPEAVLFEVFRVLRPGGFLFLTVPYLWPLHEVPYDNYRYTPFSLKRHLEMSGFSDVDLNATGGWDASLAQMIGLWVRRRPLGFLQRTLLSILLYPLYLLLLHRDRKRPVVEFGEQTMLTGLWATATKPHQK